MTAEQRQAGEQFLLSRLTTPFSWGGNDCGLFVADFLKECGQVDYAHGLRGAYEGAASARRAFESFGVNSIAGYMERIADENDWLEIPILEGRWGDVGLVNLEGRESSCVCIGSRVQATGPKGAVSLGLSLVSKMWRVL